MRTINPLLEEVHSYMVLLRQHGFLRYGKSTREYESKRNTAIDGIAHALSVKAGVDLPAPYAEMPVESLREASVTSVRRLVRVTISAMKKNLADMEPGTPTAVRYARAIAAWEKALATL